jgi:glycosyltransferase involved in cell wall biosynthesis
METYGGAERVTAEMAQAFPDAQVYSILGRQEVADRMGIGDRFTSVLPRRTRLFDSYRFAAPAFPALLGSMRLPDADVLLTSSYAFAHHFRTRNRAPQVCYCHGPLRFAWSMTDHYRDELAGGMGKSVAFEWFARTMRVADRRAAASVSTYLTQSAYTAGQIARYYGRHANVIGAPIDCNRFYPGENPAAHDGYYLFCGRLVEPYKRANLAVEAFRMLPGERLVVAGDGPARRKLEATAPPNVEFHGALGDDELVPLMQRCKSLIFPSQDDFGLLPLEVMACGRPVLAFAAGGAKYTVVPGVTGEFFTAQSPRSLREAVQAFDADAYDPELIRTHATDWDRDFFQNRLREAVEAVAA